MAESRTYRWAKDYRNLIWAFMVLEAVVGIGVMGGLDLEKYGWGHLFYMSLGDDLIWQTYGLVALYQTSGRVCLEKDRIRRISWISETSIAYEDVDEITVWGSSFGLEIVGGEETFRLRRGLADASEYIEQLREKLEHRAPEADVDEKAISTFCEGSVGNAVTGRILTEWLPWQVSILAALLLWGAAWGGYFPMNYLLAEPVVDSVTSGWEKAFEFGWFAVLGALWLPSVFFMGYIGRRAHRAPNQYPERNLALERWVYGSVLVLCGAFILAFNAATIWF